MYFTGRRPSLLAVCLRRWSHSHIVGTTISTDIWPLWPYNVNPKNRMIQYIRKMLSGLGGALNSSTRKKCVEHVPLGVLGSHCVYHLILPLRNRPIGNLRSWCKICYVWTSAMFHCYIRVLELSSTATWILTGMFQTPHHHENPQEITPPWGQNAQWPPLSWPRLQFFFTHKNSPKFPPKILKKANLKPNP